MRLLGKKAKAVLIVALLFSLVGACLPATAGETVVDVISINDFHGALEDPGASSKNPGAAKLVTAIKKAKEANPRTIAVSAGDNFNGSALSNLLYGEPVTAMMGEAGIRLSAVGNHEFDWGLDKFDAWSKGGIKFLAANVVDKETGKIVSWAAPYEIVKINGTAVGFIGLTTPESAYKATPRMVEGLRFEDPLETARKWIPVVRKAGADIVILLTHIGTFQDADTKEVTFEKDSARLAESGADGIITGHSHKGVAGMVNDVPVVQGLYNGRALAKISFRVDGATGKIISASPSLIEIYKMKASIADDAETSAMVKRYKEQVGPVLGEKIGTSSGDLPIDRKALCPGGEWVAEVMREYGGADIAVQNPGGVRRDILSGDITVGDMYEVFPFDNVLSRHSMTGAQIKELFEFGLDNEIGFIQFSGAKVTYDPKGEKGNKISGIVLDDGREVKASESYIVVTNDFVAAGGDNYTMFAGSKFLGETLPLRDALVEYIRKLGGINFVPAGRLIESAPAPAGKAADARALTPVAVRRKYTVVPGDLLWKIAVKFNTSWQTLRDLNQLKNPHLIYPGQILVLPSE